MKDLKEMRKSSYRGWKQFHPAPVDVALDFNGKPRREQLSAFGVAIAAGDVDLQPPVPATPPRTPHEIRTHLTSLARQGRLRAYYWVIS